ncbi:MAG: hypothetical protein KKI08_04580 [Armatimonadetes bacterium]|nr:hypothetical protein [Armatimonadota bacterium]
MLKRVTVLSCLVAVVALCCGGNGCDCVNEAVQQNISPASFLASLSSLGGSSGGRSVSPAQLPETVEITNADLRLGPPVAAAQARPAAADNEADFEGATAHRGTIHLTGAFTQDGNDVAIALTTLVPSQAGDSVSMAMQVTFTDEDHAAGTVQYVEDGETYTGTVTLERYPD